MKHYFLKYRINSDEGMNEICNNNYFFKQKNKNKKTN